jgi:hypothetical protein
VAALSPEVAQKLQAMAATPGNIDQSPATAGERIGARVRSASHKPQATAGAVVTNHLLTGTLAALNNPIDALVLINNLAQLQAAAPAGPAAPVDAPAAPAATPAPTSGAGMASPLMATVASVLLVAALLL